MRGPLCRHPGLPEAPISSPERVRPWARDRLLLWTKSSTPALHGKAKAEPTTDTAVAPRALR
jgi:hypothetical protein